MNQETSLNMNGFGGNAVLFLVDGERLAGETMDNVDYSRLNLDNVGRIEIVKGAASALYGANAVAGVINIISRENSEPLDCQCQHPLQRLQQGVAPWWKLQLQCREMEFADQHPAHHIR